VERLLPNRVDERLTVQVVGGDACSAEETHSALLALGQAVEQRDKYTGTHCQRMAYLGVTLGIAMGLDRDSLVALHHGGYLHDIGKVGIPDAILLKPGALTPEEWTTMRSHTTRGVEICRHLKSLSKVLPIIRNHHERLDGSGYPDGLRGTQIPLLARIMQVVDIYDALTNPRPYRKRCEAEEALDILDEETERGWRDPEIVTVFRGIYQTGSDCSLVNLNRALLGSVHNGCQPVASDATVTG
jgi:putative two-component system response regulator